MRTPHSFSWQSLLSQECVMKLLSVLLLVILAVFCTTVQGYTVPDSDQDDFDAVNEVDIDDESGEGTAKPLGVAAIKVRHVSEDPDLCSKLSRYHPHHPLCHNYCKRQGHWVGQCKKERCHCFNIWNMYFVTRKYKAKSFRKVLLLNYCWFLGPCFSGLFNLKMVRQSLFSLHFRSGLTN